MSQTGGPRFILTQTVIAHHGRGLGPHLTTRNLNDLRVRAWCCRDSTARPTSLTKNNVRSAMIADTATPAAAPEQFAKDSGATAGTDQNGGRSFEIPSRDASAMKPVRRTRRCGS